MVYAGLISGTSNGCSTPRGIVRATSANSLTEGESDSVDADEQLLRMFVGQAGVLLRNCQLFQKARAVPRPATS